MVTAAATSRTPASNKDQLKFPSFKTTAEITAEDFYNRIALLADNRLKGRYPGTPEAIEAEALIAGQMKQAGLKPGNNGSYFQKVPMVGVTLDDKNSSITFNVAKQNASEKVTTTHMQDAFFWTPHHTDGNSAANPVSLAGKEVVFGGFGVESDKFNWHDLLDKDGNSLVKDKVLILIDKEPGHGINEDPKFFNGKALTIDGRWSHKLQVAGQLGAAAVLIIPYLPPNPDVENAVWKLIGNSVGNIKRNYLKEDNTNNTRASVEGFIKPELARQLGLDIEALKKEAATPGFRARTLPNVTFSASTQSAVNHFTSNNIIGILPGKKKNSNKYFAYMAHWDHLGERQNQEGADKIFNGAIDNATGVAGILEIAESMAKGAVKPEEDQVFIATTGEESGMIGAKYYAQHPVLPLSDALGLVNIDEMVPTDSRALDFAYTAYGSTLEDRLTAVAKATQNRETVEDVNVQQGFPFRNDAYYFALKGVPAIFGWGGRKLVNGKDGEAIFTEFDDNHYHQPSDEMKLLSIGNVVGLIDDLRLYRDLGLDVSKGSSPRPQYRENSDFYRPR